MAAPSTENAETMTWSCCVVNCGTHCPLRVFTRKGRVVRIEAEAPATDGSFQTRPCLRGRSVRARLYSKDRLRTPLLRVGPRGSGRFRMLSWDEALDIAASRLKSVIERYGNEAVFLQYGSGSHQLVSSKCAGQRLLNLLGGYLGSYGTYSSAQISCALPYTYGKGSGTYGSHMPEIANSALYVSFGHNPFSTRQPGCGQAWELLNVLGRERPEGGKPRMILFDPVYTETALGKEAEWVPVRVGTDAALVEAMAWVMITEGLVDQAFLDRYCVGYDEKTLPPQAPAHADYKSYILGLGPDGLAKTPEWAAPVTGVPAGKIRHLARLIATTKPLFVAQGYGCQRQANGEQACRAIAMLPLLTGQIGLPGTNTGAREGSARAGEVGLPTGTNPVKTKISFFSWVDAIDHGERMTALADGVRGADRLKVPIKFLWTQNSNVNMNQHSDQNGTARVLADETKCEFILVIDNQMTPTARWADLILPDLSQLENTDYAASSYSAGDDCWLVPLQPAVEPFGEAKSAYWICTQLARRFGLEQAFTEGRSQMDWVRWCYEQTRAKHPQLPDFDTFWKVGLVKLPDQARGKTVAMADYRADPDAHPCATPSGKIEIYSQRLADIAATWQLRDGDVITPLPQFVRTFEMPGDPLAERYPLQCFGLHGQGHVHSSYANLAWMKEAHEDRLLINPVDAQPRGLADGDEAEVFNGRGCVRLPVTVTSRIMPGVVAFPQGGWFAPGPDGVDSGPSINTLTSPRPSPLAKANPQHTNLVEVRRVRPAGA